MWQDSAYSHQSRAWPRTGAAGRRARNSRTRARRSSPAAQHTASLYCRCGHREGYGGRTGDAGLRQLLTEVRCSDTVSSVRCAARRGRARERSGCSVRSRRTRARADAGRST